MNSTPFEIHPTPFQLAQLAATLASAKPQADSTELAKAAKNIWAACAIAALSLQPKPDKADALPPSCRPETEDEARARERRDAPNVELEKLLVELMPSDDKAARLAQYRHFWNDKKQDGADMIAFHKAHGVDAYLAGYIRGDFAKYRKATISALRREAGAKGAQSREEKKRLKSEKAKKRKRHA